MAQVGVVEERWRRQSAAERRCGNGIRLAAGCAYKRVLTPLGVGLRVRGLVLLPSLELDGDGGGERLLQWDVKDRDAVYTFEQRTVLLRREGYGELVALPGASIDAASCVLHGPLEYFGTPIGREGGVHVNGCAFAAGAGGGAGASGANDAEAPRYNELCIEWSVAQARQQQEAASGSSSSSRNHKKKKAQAKAAAATETVAAASETDHHDHGDATDSTSASLQ